VNARCGHTANTAEYTECTVCECTVWAYHTVQAPAPSLSLGGGSDLQSYMLSVGPGSSRSLASRRGARACTCRLCGVYVGACCGCAGVGVWRREGEDGAGGGEGRASIIFPQPRCLGRVLQRTNELRRRASPSVVKSVSLANQRTEVSRAYSRTHAHTHAWTHAHALSQTRSHTGTRTHTAGGATRAAVADIDFDPRLFGQPPQGAPSDSGGAAREAAGACLRVEVELQPTAGGSSSTTTGGWRSYPL
jgi:hypothetical protein